MNRRMLFLFIIVALSGCKPPPVVEGKIVSLKEKGQGITEVLVQTDSRQIPTYILRLTNDDLDEGAKIVLEFPIESADYMGY